MAFFLGFVTVLVVLFSIALSGYITFFNTSIQNLFYRLALFIVLSLCVFLITSITTLLIIWPPL